MDFVYNMIRFTFVSSRADNSLSFAGRSCIADTFLRIFPRAPIVTPFFSRVSSFKARISSYENSSKTFVYLWSLSDLSHSRISAIRYSHNSQ